MKYNRSTIIISFCIFIIIMIYLLEPVPNCKIGDNFKLNDSNQSAYKNISEIFKIKSFNLLIIGTSMEPTIKEFSSCYCERKNEYFIGEIVSYIGLIDSEEKLITHRIIFQSDQGVVYTKGDNNDFMDNPISKNNIVCAIPSVPRIRTLY